jgi:hypothetical protein
MILIKKIKPGLWQPNEQETGAIMVIAKKTGPAFEFKVGEIGIVRCTHKSNWEIAMQDGYDGLYWDTFQKLIKEEQTHFDFYYIEIKP